MQFQENLDSTSITAMDYSVGNSSFNLQAFAEAEKIRFLETSALKNVNVEQAFSSLLTDIYGAATRKIFAAQYSDDKDLNGTKIELDTNSTGQRSGLCSWSCCGAVSRLMGATAPSKQA